MSTKKSRSRRINLEEKRKEHGRRWKSRTKAEIREEFRRGKKTGVGLEDLSGDLREMIKTSLLAMGSVQVRYVTCGKKDCRCMKRDGKRHGPYYYFSLPLPAEMVKAGRPRVKHFYITPEEAEEIDKRIANFRKLQERIWDEVWAEFTESGTESVR
jgi:hypothetical protein